MKTHSHFTNLAAPATPSLAFLVPLGGEQQAERIAFATSHGLGLEITSFISGPPLNDPHARAALEGTMQDRLASFSGHRILHGAFLDLAIHSQDQHIAMASRARIQRDLHTASLLGCSKVVFHLGFNPLITSPSHRDDIIESHAAFWASALAPHPGLIVCLENQWEQDWSIFQELFEILDHPRVGMCLDVAHAHIHSHFSPSAWLLKMGSHIRHMHWNDNHGDRDSHSPLGSGNISWPAIFSAARTLHRPTVTLEMTSSSALRSSLSYLLERGIETATAAPASVQTSRP